MRTPLTLDKRENAVIHFRGRQVTPVGRAASGLC